MTDDKKRIVALISGNGSNLQAFIDQCQDGRLPAEIACVISNKPNAYGLERAQQAGIENRVIEHNRYPDRQAFDQALAETIASYQPDLVILAGFMRILTPAFVEQFYGRLLNIHPSLLPNYRGLNTHQRAIDAGDRHGGTTVHFVSSELDGGPCIIQAKVPIDTNDTAQSLAEKVQAYEHIIYPMAAQWFLEERLALHEDGASLDQKKLPAGGYDYQASAP